MIVLLAAITVLAGQSAPAEPAPGVDPAIEKLFYPAFQLHQTVDTGLRRSPQFRARFTQLGDRACPVYLQAWRAAYDAHFTAYRDATYAVIRKNIPEEVLRRPDLGFLDGAIIDKYGIPAQMSGSPAGAALRQIGAAIVAEVFAAEGPAPAPGSEAAAAKALDAPGPLCGFGVTVIERRGLFSR